MKGLRQRRGSYYYEFYDPHKSPPRREYPLRTKDKREAVQIAGRYWNEYVAGTFDPWKDKRPKRLSLDDAIKAFKRTRRRTTKQTQAAYTSTLKLFSESTRATSIDRVREEDIERFALSPKYTVKTQNAHLQRLEAFFNWAIEEGHVETNLARVVREKANQRNVRRRKKSKPRRDFFMPDELARLSAQIQIDADGRTLEDGGRIWPRAYVRDMLEVAACTGLRVSSLCRLNQGDVRFRMVDTDRGRQALAGQLTARATKGGDDLIIPLVPRAALLLKSWIDRHPTEAPKHPVFVGPKTKRRLDPRTVSEHTGTYRTDAGLRDTLTFHSTRHSFISWMLMLGLPVYTVKELAGHSDLRMTEQYAHMVRRTLLGQAREVAADVLAFYCPGIERDQLLQAVSGAAGAGLGGYAFGGNHMLDILFGAALYRKPEEPKTHVQKHVRAEHVRNSENTSVAGSFDNRLF